MKATHRITHIVLLALLLILGGCTSPTTEQSASLKFGFSQFDVLNKAQSRYTRAALGDTDEITSVTIKVSEYVDGEPSEIASATLSEELETATLTIPSGKLLNVKGDAFAGEELRFFGNMDVEALLPGKVQAINLIMYPADGSADPIQVDVGVANKVGNGPSVGATFSYSRDFVLFISKADNLVEGDTNEKPDLFLKNVATGEIFNMHLDENGNPVSTLDDEGPTGGDISADGRFVVFASNADGIVAADKNGLSDIFLRDTALNTVILVSKKSDGSIADANSYNPSISDDGRFIAFSSDAKLIGDKGGVYLYDRLTAKLSFLIADAVNPKFSGNGKYLVYVDSSDGNLYRYSTEGKTKVRITDVAANNKPGKSAIEKVTTRDHITVNEFEYIINESGRYIVFVPYIQLGELLAHHVYLYDDTEKTISLVSADSGGNALPLNDKFPRYPSISQDGRFVVFLFNDTVYVKSILDEKLSPVIRGAFPFISPDGSEIGYSSPVDGHLFFLPNPLFSVVATSAANNNIPTGLAYELSGDNIIISWNEIDNTSFYRLYRSENDDLIGDATALLVEATGNQHTFPYDEIRNKSVFLGVSSVNSQGESPLSTHLNIPADFTPPELLSDTVSPTDGTTDVETNTTISFSFNEDMADESINAISINLVQDATVLPALIELNGADVVIKPKVELMPFSEYEILVTAGVTDRAGNSLVQTQSWKFTTGFQQNKLASGATHSCLIKQDGSLWCWGYNGYGQLGNGDYTSYSTPVQEVTKATDWLSVSVGGSDWGGYVTCGIKQDQSLWCWGNNYLFDPIFIDQQDAHTPSQVGMDTDWEMVSIGGDHLCGITSNRAIQCAGIQRLLGTNQDNWVETGFTPLGDYTHAGIPLPNSGWINIATGDADEWDGDGHTCAIRQESNPGDDIAEPVGVFCWGDNMFNQVGPDDNQEYYYGYPYHYSSETDWRRISAGSQNSCLINQSNELYCWGANVSGQLAIDPGILDQTPDLQQINGEWNDIQNSRGAPSEKYTYEFHSCATKLDGTAWCWGGNSYGQLGQDMPELNFLPQQEQSLRQDWFTVKTGGYFNCALTRDSESWCWGSTELGYLGNGQSMGSATPVQEAQQANDWDMVSTSTGYSDIESHSCAIKEDGTLWCWGHDYQGSLGIDAEPWTIEDTPVQVTPGKENWVQVSNGAYHSCAVDAENKLFCWGYNSSWANRLGLGEDTSSKSVPTPINPNDDWVSVTAGVDQTCAIQLGAEDSRRLYCWGDNYYGQLGVADNLDKTIPTLVQGGFTDWKAVSTQNNHTCGIRDTGDMYCWGYNYYGQLGNGATGGYPHPYNTPGLVLGNHNWQQVSVGYYHTCGIDSDSILRCWGFSNYFTDMQGPDFTQPVSITPGQQWKHVDTSQNANCSIRMNGTLWCFGFNEDGQFGNGTIEDSKTPVQEITQAINWGTVSVGAAYACATKTDKSLFCWGSNHSGQLGTGVKPYQTSPVKVDFAEDPTPSIPQHLSCQCED
jgi:alpha-tubulin suppressor-like RCC1 family protein/Tol biopolymer transport system component